MTLECSAVELLLEFQWVHCSLAFWMKNKKLFRKLLPLHLLGQESNLSLKANLLRIVLVDLISLMREKETIIIEKIKKLTCFIFYYLNMVMIYMNLINYFIYKLGIWVFIWIGLECDV